MGSIDKISSKKKDVKEERLDEQVGTAEQKLKLLLDKLHGEEHYFYDKFIEFLSKRCQVTVLKKKPLDLKLLTENDVLMLITPTKSWEESEVETVRRYVEDYGGILVVTTTCRRNPKHLNKLLEPYGLSVTGGWIDEKYLDKGNLEASPLLEGVGSLALSTWGAMSTKIAASNEAEVMLRYKDAILGAKRSLGKGAAYLFCLSAFGDKQLDQVDNRIFLDNLLKSLSMPAMTATLEAIAKDEALAAQAITTDKALVAQETEEKSQTEDMTTGEINETEVDLSEKFSWREASVREGIITFECPECKKTHSLKTTLFSSQSPNPAVGLMPTSQEILWGKEIGSMVLAFVVAVTFGAFVAVLVGFHIWIGIVCAVIFMILKPVFAPKFMNKLPVWIFKCSSCGKKTFIASDGTEAAIGELQANVGE